jgi:hypothetical protein
MNFFFLLIIFKRYRDILKKELMFVREKNKITAIKICGLKTLYI